MAPRSFGKRLWYDGLRVVAQLAGVTLFHVRCRGRKYLPTVGGALVLSNHQSNLDPALIGLTCDRRMYYVARQTLYESAFLTRLFNSLDTIPIDREGGGLGGLKEMLRRLKQGEMVLLFPEGTRTANGDVGPLKPGFSILARRAQVPLVPVAIDGAFDSWPRSQRLPRPAVIHVEYGPPLVPDEVQRLSDAELVAEVERRLQECHRRARAHRRRAREADSGVTADGGTFVPPEPQIKSG